MSGSLVVSGLSTARLNWTNFATSGGNYLYVVNGVDAPRAYDGSAWSSPSITGVTGGSSTLSAVFPYRSRLFFLKKDSSDLYYLPVDSIAGAALKITVGAELRLGGTLVAGCAFSTDYNSLGPSNNLAVISSNGEVVIYSGTNPSDAAAWQLLGTFRVGRPIGDRCLVQIGGDVAALTQDGVISLSAAAAIDRSVEQKAAFTSSIRRAFADQYKLTGTLHGWQVNLWAAGHMAIVNVPISELSTSRQFVMNVLSGAWCRFTDIDSLCWVTAQDSIYFGTADGYVMRFGEAGSDNGKDINAFCIGAFSDMKNAGVVKHAKAALVLSKASGNYSIGVNVLADFNVASTSTSDASFTFNSSGPLWDVSLWDHATWTEGTDSVINKAWMGIAGSGYYLAPVILTSANATEPTDVEFIAMNVLYEKGAPLG